MYNLLDKLVLDPFLKNKNWPHLWVNGLKFYTVCFYCMARWGLSKYIKTKLKTICFTSYSAFQKIKRRLELASLPHDLWRKIFLLLYSINWPNLTVWLPLLCEIFGKCIVIICKLSSGVMNFEVKLIFLIKPFSLYMTKKSWQKLKYLEKEKSFWDEIKIIFHNFLRAFSQAYNTKCFWRVRVRL